MSNIKNIAVILNYNDAETTLSLAHKLSQYARIDLVMIVDNVSTDNSLDLLTQTNNPKLEVVVAKRNGGYATGNNFGLKIASQRYNPEIFLIANPDIDIDESTLNQCLDYLKNAEAFVACVAPTMVLKKGSMNTAWRLPNYWIMWLSAMIPIRPLLNAWIAYPISSRKTEITKVDVLAGSLFFARANALEKVDYFDERTFLFGEENILAFKLKMAGYQSILLNRLSYLHQHSLTINKNFSLVKDKFKFAYQSDLIYLKHYLQVSNLKIKLYNLQYQCGLALFLGMKQAQRILVGHKDLNTASNKENHHE